MRVKACIISLSERSALVQLCPTNRHRNQLHLCYALNTIFSYQNNIVLPISATTSAPAMPHPPSSLLSSHPANSNLSRKALEVCCSMSHLLASCSPVLSVRPLCPPSQS
jgi:hypothetical protein